MCYDIALHSDIALTKQAFPKIIDKRISQSTVLQQHTQSFSFASLPVVIQKDGELSLVDMQWFVDPSYLTDPKQRVKQRISMANAQSERVLRDKRSYWYTLRTNRCLIPLSGTYEHREIAGWKNKVPYYIWMKDRGIQHIPSLYQLLETVGTNGEIITQGSFTMLTRTANQTMKGIHNSGEHRHRMPLFLTPELEDFWVSPHFSEDDMKAVFEYELPSGLLDFSPVYSIRGKAVRPDGKATFEPWHYENLPPLGTDTPLQSQMSLF
ncbi:SOS response-associated peptidase [Dyadobacter frigoris]|uniref:Abasic site processing protein n=1 Tax=Dyadobacter frigoris TaxID=2576211 RepID=A0A4U6D879_9BACT|nr:SOS response-associated peptidase family protein [Dyadobacter frigoris]TKT90344.1 SOS response-associated peptidase [Dyadobacter frigoris]GLU52587.1 hypothetical protein Dfri01_20480 [Dyadobacter frigoris]